jgi:hypothetical protein
VKTKKRKLSPRALSVLIALGAIAIIAAGMFFLVLPQRHKASSLDKQVVETQKAIEAARIAAEPQHVQPIRVANLFKLVKAMPDTPDMSGILLQLNQTASDAGIEFDSITLGAVDVTNPTVVPIALEFNGNFYDLDDFLFRVRNLVAVRGGSLQATGRLFSVQSIDFGPGVGGFPSINAKLSLNAYVYGAPPATPTATGTPTTTDTTSTDTTSTDTTTTETTPSSAGSAVAAGATS